MSFTGGANYGQNNFNSYNLLPINNSHIEKPKLNTIAHNYPEYSNARLNNIKNNDKDKNDSKKIYDDDDVN